MIGTTDSMPSAAELERLDADFPTRYMVLGAGTRIAFRECGSGPLVLCLHGIGSNAGSWVHVARELRHRARVLAWDMPGYGESSPVVPSMPDASHYATRLSELASRLGARDFVLTGHSLGAIVAAAAVRRFPQFAQQVRALVFVSPARGYGAAGKEAVRQKVYRDRLDSLKQLGIGGLADTRSMRLVSEGASAAHLAWVRLALAQLDEAGYRQAIELLCGADLLSDLPLPVPVRVLCGERDVVTEPAACGEVAIRCGMPLELIVGAGHASPVERPQAVAAAISQMAGSEPQRP
ncbi:alpha/beta fold hydrolase [Ramlibacter aurantiacus]|nr:alpha/beta hydrolase [Ramlibacter aurantiacus]